MTRLRLSDVLSLVVAAHMATESLAAKRTFAKKNGKTQTIITVVVVIGTVLLALLCAIYCQCGDRFYTRGAGRARKVDNKDEQEPLIPVATATPLPPP